MDLVVREIRAITEGDLNIIRLGSCGTPREDIAIGTVVVAKKSFAILTNPDAYLDRTEEIPPFTFTQTREASPILHDILKKALGNKGAFPVVEATDGTAEFFYSTQGRTDPEFYDKNENLLKDVLIQYPDTGSLQMETFHLYQLSELNSRTNPFSERHIKVAACAIVLAQRHTNEFLPNDKKREIEKIAGDACLEALFNNFVDSI